MKEIFARYESILLRYEILLWESEPTTYRFKAQLYFIDGSNLIVKDYLFPSGRKYSFHWQDKHDCLLIRWDNAEHWKDIPTYPHHKHLDGQILPSRETVIEDIMDQTSKLITSGVI
jgi:hypothetical protein